MFPHGGQITSSDLALLALVSAYFLWRRGSSPLSELQQRIRPQAWVLS
jgi:hypothetical protein